MTEENKGLGDLICTYDTVAGEAVGKRESHTPRIEAPDVVKADEAFEIKVSVGPHPNKVEHSIRWIEVYFREEGRAFNPLMLARVAFTPAYSEPKVAFRLNLRKSGTIFVLQYCNVHGLWSAEKDVGVE
ncbi:MAG: class II SORL domain-containing protein [Euryarchaeota archaeon]|nr:class II SORL domain-containing protein [Euryarchaeota archaeon]